MTARKVANVLCLIGPLYCEGLLSLQSAVQIYQDELTWEEVMDDFEIWVPTDFQQIPGSLVTQRFDWVEFGRLHRRQPTANHSNNHQDQR